MKLKKYNMVSIKKYFGITFGPIDRVLSYAKSTRSIWASSYFFSDLAKRIVEPLFNAGCRFLKPSVDGDMFKPSSVGKFPDQYVFEGTDKISFIEALRKICDNVLCDVGNRMVRCLGLNMNEGQMFDYLRRKIKIYIVEYESERDDSAAAVKAIQNMLSCAECRDIYPDIERNNYLSNLFEKKISDLKSFFGPMDLDVFESLPEVASNHYVVFVNADGDNFGQNLALNPALSQRFQKFGMYIRNVIQRYGGQAIYQGGDDISFYAPLYNGKVDIFCLLRGLDKKLNKHLKGSNITDNVPSLSYGIAISYEKYPMAETRQRAKALLDEAKKQPGKNSIVWELRKHSGQTNGGVIKKSNVNLYNAIIGLIICSFSGDQEFLHSVTFWLKRHEQPLRYILSQPDDQPDAQNENSRGKRKLLKNFINNNFNESVHKQHQDYLAKVKEILCLKSDESNPTEAIDYIHSLLRYVEHLVSVVNNV